MGFNANVRRALLVVRDASRLSGGDQIIRARLERLGYNVIRTEDSVAVATAANHSVVVCSSVVGPPNLSEGFLSLNVPIVVLGDSLYDDLGMTGRVAGQDYGRSEEVGEVFIDGAGHSMAAGLEGRVGVVTARCEMIWARPLPSAVKIATLPGDAGPGRRVAVFGYEAGAELRDGKAPARRVGIFFERETAALLNNNGWALFDAAIQWAVGEELKQFPEVFREEWQEIKERRLRQRIEAGGQVGSRAREEGEEESAPENLVGLALSGGGIRSATFCLGLLRGMQEHGLLRVFDYISTVSGGGYLGGWWSAWLARYGQYSQSRSGYPQFAVYDIEQPVRLASFFNQPERAATPDEASCPADVRLQVGGRIKQFFEANYPGFLDKFCSHPKPEPSDRKDFINCLNNLLLEEELFYGLCDDLKADERLPGLEDLRERINAGRAGGGAPDKNHVRRFNRMLLELVYGAEMRREVFPPAEKIDPVRTSRYFSDKDKPEAWSQDQKRRAEQMAETAKDIMCAGHDPVHHLRLFANYLTPRKGVFSGDTWRAVAVVTRNLVMTWITLMPLLIAFVLAAQLYFAVRTPSESGGAAVGALAHHTWERQSIWQDAEAAAAPKLRVGVQAIPTPPPYVHDFSYPYWQHIAQLEKFKADLTREASNLEAVGRKEAADVVRSRTLNVDALAEEMRRARDASLTRRVWWAVYPLAFLLSLIVAMTAAWMVRNTSGSQTLGLLGGTAFWLLLVCWLAAFLPYSKDESIPLLLRVPAALTKYLGGLFDPPLSVMLLEQKVGARHWAALGLWVAVVGGLLLWAWRRRTDAGAGAAVDEDEETQAQWHQEVQRNRTTQVHTQLLICLAVLAGAFLLAGFGHELISYAYYSRENLLARTGGGAAALLAVLGAIWTAVKASPVGGGDEKENAHPSLASRIIFAATPPLVLVVLALVIGWLAHYVFCFVIRAHDVTPVWWLTAPLGRGIPALTVATFIGAGLCVILAASEIRSRRWRLRKRLLVWTTLIGSSSLFVYLLDRYGLTGRPVTALCFALLAACFFLPRLAVDEARGKEDSKQRTFRLILFKHFLKDREITWKHLIGGCLLLFVVSVAAVLLLAWGAPQEVKDALVKFVPTRGRIPGSQVPLAGGAMAMSLICVASLVFEIMRGSGSNRRSIWLLSSVCLMMAAMMFFSLFDSYAGRSHYLLAHAIVGLLALTLGLVIALGWLADPNALSMHQFYRDRLVRAYLGASNAARRTRLKHITESVEGDDVMLWQLKNCQRGAPYHIINTTLNLAAGRDITTAQRSSAMFVLTKHSCGSSRTGYRSSERYMGGRLSLGTAIAASGAAASPNMGSRTPPASLAMLMTILNVRLGFWAPTPNKDHWYKGQPQLWPFYLLREFFSQTNELSPYCYLTDGGHFDNTGIYSLVERGCRFIIAADCGADPEPCFSDLGDAIRRCRIDFGAMIDLDIKPFLKDDRGRAAGYFAVGTITYSEEHARSLRWKNPGERTGVIVLFKPSRTSDGPADVQQYAIENSNFPHQTTADQWFDESQFESYRRLGQHCAETAFATLDATEKIRD
ncbi:MAG TPA: hypothetical protein VK422_17030, partial [Pyrinomonadaceae bacterium]|nr:hypothetical protein [Pyrinomonadaceae bacterium]